MSCVILHWAMDRGWTGSVCTFSLRLGTNSIPLQVDTDSAAVAGGGLVDEREDPRGDGGPLDGKRRHQHVEGDAAETIATQKRHQETKTNEYHHMDILED